MKAKKRNLEIAVEGKNLEVILKQTPLFNQYSERLKEKFCTAEYGLNKANYNTLNKTFSKLTEHLSDREKRKYFKNFLRIPLAYEVKDRSKILQTLNDTLRLKRMRSENIESKSRMYLNFINRYSENNTSNLPSCEEFKTMMREDLSGQSYTTNDPTRRLRKAKSNQGRSIGQKYGSRKIFS